MSAEPPDESSRLRTLHQLGLLDTPEDDRFDRITATAALVFGTPMALVSLVDHDRQWFKSHHGLAVRETPRAIAFCSHVVDRCEPLVVEDARADPTFDDNPLVTGEPHIRFYAGHPLLDRSGAVLGTLSILDTDRRTLSPNERELLAALAPWAESEILLGESTAMKEAVERATNVKNEFLSRVSHELRTPLNSILGFAQLFELGPMDDADRVGSARAILRSGRHLLSLIDELIDIARIEAGEVVLDTEPLDPAEVIAEAVHVVNAQAAAAGITVVIETCGEANVLADRRRVLQVLINLLSNAVKYNRPGGTVKVRSARSEAGGLVGIAVQDTGWGIPAADLGRVFQPFDRLGAEERGIEGTGVGLSIAAGLVDLMGGVLTVASTVDVGTTFTVLLPETSATPSATATRAAAAREPSATHPLRVLYIEDNPVNLDLVERALASRSRIEVIGAPTGEEGLRLAKHERPGLILLDLRLPDTSGEDVLAALKTTADLAAIPVVVLTADARPNLADRLLQAGAADVLTKPLDLAQLFTVVERHGRREPTRLRPAADPISRRTRAGR